MDGRKTRVNHTSKSSNMNSFMRTRKSTRAYDKFAIFKKLLSRKNNSTDKKNKYKKRNPYIVLLKRVMIATSFVFLLVILAGCIVVALFISDVSKSIANIDPDAPFKNAGLQGDTYIYSGDGVELSRLSGLQSKDFIKIEDVPDYVRAAFVAAEDKTFYENKGVDLFGLARAVVSTVFKNDVQGGSTITQQVVKNTVAEVGNEQSLKRKVKELILSVQIAQKYSKDQVLQLYINSIGFGSNFIGVKRAAKAYFNKEVKDLTYGEAALLAGLPNDPSRLAPSPYNAPGTDPYDTLSDGTKILANVNREKAILDRMAEIANDLNSKQGFHIDLEKIKEAKSTDLVYNMPKIEARAPHLTAPGGPVYRELQTIFKDKQNVDQFITSGGLRVYLTLDYDMQQKAEAETAKIDDNTEVIKGGKTSWQLFGARNSAIISVNPKTGAVLSYAGSAGFDRNDGAQINGQVDMIQTPVPEGSSMKVANYMDAMIQKGLGPESTFANLDPLQISSSYSIKNYSIAKHTGLDITIREAVSQSYNIPAVQSLIVGGVDNYADLVAKMGYNAQEVQAIRDAGIVATLGTARISPWSHAQLFQVMANGGVKKDLYTVEKVTDAQGNLLYQHPNNPGVQVVDAKYVYLMYDILKGYYTVGTMRNLGYDCAGKTGTYANDDSKSGSSNHIVFWGYCTDIVTGIWAGNNDNSSLTSYAVGENLGQTHWNAYMKAIAPKLTKDRMYPTRPAGVVEKTICKDTGFIATADNPCEKTVGLFADTPAGITDANHVKLRVTDCSNGIKLASRADELAGKAYDKVFTHFTTLTGIDLIQKQMDDFAVNKLGLPLPPTDYCTDTRTGDGSLLTVFTAPAAGTVYNVGDTISMSVDTVATNATVKFYFDGNLLSTTSSAPYAAQYTIAPGTAPGPHTLRADVTDSTGKTGSATQSIAIKSTLSQASISITSPTAGTNITGNNITVTAAITDPANAVKSVQFYGQKQGDTAYVLIGTGTKSGSNYTVNWSRPSNGGPNFAVFNVYAVAVGSTPTDTIQSAVVSFNWK